MSESGGKAGWFERLKVIVQPRQSDCCSIDFEPLEEESAGEASTTGSAPDPAPAPVTTPEQAGGCCGGRPVRPGK